MRGCWVGKGTIDKREFRNTCSSVLKLMNYGSGRVGEARVARAGWHMATYVPLQGNSRSG